MCGRYELHSQPAAIALAFGLDRPPDIRPRYNIAPTTDVPIVRINPAGNRELTHMRWGLVPRWAKDTSIGAKMINARGETIAEKPSFRTAYRRHRCLFPADGFYEWMALGPGATPGAPPRKQPMHIGMRDGGLFGLGGLYERWRSPEGDILDSCTIVTTAANAVLKRVHDRMPLIISPQDYARWLNPAVTDVADLIVPFPAAAVHYFPISTKVNNVHHDDASLIAPAAPLPEVREAQVDDEHPPPPEQESLF